MSQPLTNREFLGEEFYKFGIQDYQTLREYRNTISQRRPTDEEQLFLRINKPWEAFWRKILL